MQAMPTPSRKISGRSVPRALILCERSGDHCNRLFQSIHFHAFCLEHGLWFWNPTMLGMLRSLGPVSPRCGDVANTIFSQLLKLCQRYRVKQNWITEPSQDHWFQFVGGWSYRCHSLTARYRKIFQRYYRLRRRLTASENDVLVKLWRAKAAGSVAVGIHIRRGDYQEWQGGRFFFHDDVYLRIISQVRDYYRDKSLSCWVVVCSNDSEAPVCGQDQVSRGRWFADQLVLQNCDVLVGPPSTFTLWASYISEIPLLQIESASQTVDLTRCAICDG